MNHYKSWSGLNKQLCDCLCDSLKDRISYFLTRYHEVHNSYGRASIRLDGKELVNFSWVEMIQQENDMSELWKQRGNLSCNEQELKKKWTENATFSDLNFLQAATAFLQMPVADALESDDCLIRIFAIMDRRTGIRTLKRIRDSKVYKTYPDWVQQFYELRFREDLD